MSPLLRASLTSSALLFSPVMPLLPAVFTSLEAIEFSFDRSCSSVMGTPKKAGERPAADNRALSLRGRCL